MRADERRRRHPHGLPQGPGRALPRGRRARDGPRHVRRARDGRQRARTTRCSRWTSRATTTSCSSSPRTATASAPASTSTARPTRGAKGVGTIKLTEAKGALAGALVVREHQELVFISREGMVQRTGVARHQPLRAPLAGRAGDEHPRRRRRQRGRARHGVRARGRGRRRRGLRPRGRRVRGRREQRRRRDRTPTGPPPTSPPATSRTPRRERTPTTVETVGVFRYSGDTRERRWSVSTVRVLAGPWR